MHTAYNYHPLTGAFTTAFAPDYSPLEPEVPLLPQFSTMLVPPACSAREVAVFSDGQWQRQPDWRNVVLYSRSTGEALSITDIGTTPEAMNATELAPPSPHHVWCEDGWVLDEARRQQAFIAEKARAMSLIDRFHMDVVMQLVGHPTQVEKDTWALKLDVANAIVAGTGPSPAGQAFLSGAGLVSGAQQTQWAAAVLAKSAAYAGIVGQAELLRHDAREAIAASTDEDALRAALRAQRDAADAVVRSLAGID